MKDSWAQLSQHFMESHHIISQCKRNQRIGSGLVHFDKHF
uniref:Uncharacterized protein n=1 Tax=Anguilla anguilla TaxID=7936 RepID=A0A0E9VEJ2_ANGAN